MLYQPGERSPYGVSVKRFSWRQFSNEWVKPFLTVLLFGVVINLFFPRYYVLGHSMEPQLHEYDWLFTSSLNALTQSIQRGDIVVLVSPYDGALAVKRVIGLPGEQVRILAGQVFINDTALNEDYIEESATYNGFWQVAADQYFVMGDNRNHSLDSVDYGPIDKSRIRGAVKFRLWPLADFGMFHAPDYAESEVQ